VNGSRPRPPNPQFAPCRGSNFHGLRSQPRLPRSGGVSVPVPMRGGGGGGSDGDTDGMPNHTSHRKIRGHPHHRPSLKKHSPSTSQPRVGALPTKAKRLLPPASSIGSRLMKRPCLGL